jgi:hypothetical protein
MTIGPRRCAHVKQVNHFLHLLALLSVALFPGKSTRKHVCFSPPFSRVHALFCCLQKLWKHNLRVKPSSQHCSIGDEQHVGHQTPEWRPALSTISDATATVKLLCYLCVLEAIYVFEFGKILLHKISFQFKVLKSSSVFAFPLFLCLVMPFSVSQQAVITFFHSQII